MTTEAVVQSGITFGLVDALRRSRPRPAGLVDGAHDLFAPTSPAEKLDLTRATGIANGFDHER